MTKQKREPEPRLPRARFRFTFSPGLNCTCCRVFLFLVGLLLCRTVSQETVPGSNVRDAAPSSVVKASISACAAFATKAAAGSFIPSGSFPRHTSRATWHSQAQRSSSATLRTRHHSDSTSPNTRSRFCQSLNPKSRYFFLQKKPPGSDSCYTQRVFGALCTAVAREEECKGRARAA